MSEKARDNHGRWRSKTIAFRISPEENELLDEKVRLSGLTKQAYLIQCVLNHEVTVLPNPRVHKALREKMGQLCEVFRKFENVSEVSAEQLEVLGFIGEIYEGLNR